MHLKNWGLKSSYMKKLHRGLIVFFFLFLSLAGFAQDFQFVANERENGTAFFSLDAKTGQLSFMLDHGTDAGLWKKYGNPLGALQGGKFLFEAIERAQGTAFFVMESRSGQVYYMLDYGDTPGIWTKYGSQIGTDGYSFKANGREDGTAFFAMNIVSGQVYFMLDYGSESGIWKAYGDKLKK